MKTRLTAVTSVLAALLAAGVASADPGLLLVLDTERFRITTRDLRAADTGPEARVVLGSPANPTPRGEFPLYQVVRDPGWTPGERAREGGARPEPASPSGPMGVAKIPFARGGYALHGGAHPLLLGKPVSLGCVRIDDGDLLGLIAWLESRGALGPVRENAGEGGQRQDFRRPSRLIIR